MIFQKELYLKLYTIQIIVFFIVTDKNLQHLLKKGMFYLKFEIYRTLLTTIATYSKSHSKTFTNTDTTVP